MKIDDLFKKDERKIRKLYETRLLAGIVVLMIWLFLLSYIITIGLALNYSEEVITLEKTAQIDIIEE